MTMQLGPALFDLLNRRQWVGNMKPVVYGKGGLTDAELDAIAAQLGFPLPPDFRMLFRNVRDDGGVLFNYKHFDKAKYDKIMEWLQEGIEFDIEHDALWLPRWGQKPAALPEQFKVMRAHFKTWPKLLPLLGHRFLPAEPCEPGNPVFSIMQTDIIYYGSDLPEYLLNEFVQDVVTRDLKVTIRHIPVWSDFVR